MNRTAIAVGLLVALAGPPLVAVLSLRISGPMPSAAASIAGQAALWALAAAVLGIVLLWERLPLRSIGAVPLTGASLLAAVLAAAALLYVATPIGLWLVNALGLPGFEAGVSRLRSLPAGVLVCAAATAGVVEELLYRGYAIERQTVLTGSRAAAALLSLAAFSLAHLPFWGAGSALLTAVAGIVLTALYLWRRSLAANMVAHALRRGPADRHHAGLIGHVLWQHRMSRLPPSRTPAHSKTRPTCLSCAPTANAATAICRPIPRRPASVRSNAPSANGARATCSAGIARIAAASSWSGRGVPAPSSPGSRHRPSAFSSPAAAPQRPRHASAGRGRSKRAERFFVPALR